MSDQHPPDPGYEPTIPLPIADSPAEPPPPPPLAPTGPTGPGDSRDLRPWLIAAVVLLALLVVLVLVLLLTGGDDDGDEPDVTLPPETTTSTTLGTSTTSTSAAPRTTTTVAAPVTTAPVTTAPPTTSPPTTAVSGPQVTQVNASAIDCPNPLVLTWSTVNATRVEVAIDSPGGVFDSGPANGSLEVPAPCNGDTQTYYVTAIDALNDRNTRVLTCTEANGCVAG